MRTRYQATRYGLRAYTPWYAEPLAFVVGMARDGIAPLAFMLLTMAASGVVVLLYGYWPR